MTRNVPLQILRRNSNLSWSSCCVWIQFPNTCSLQMKHLIMLFSNADLQIKPVHVLVSRKYLAQCPFRWWYRKSWCLFYERVIRIQRCEERNEQSRGVSGNDRQTTKIKRELKGVRRTRLLCPYLVERTFPFIQSVSFGVLFWSIDWRSGIFQIDSSLFVHAVIWLVVQIWFGGRICISSWNNL
jgi:hypothetical protein